MSVDGRTVWWAKDAAWWRREAVVELLEEVGCAGPCVVDWLACEAKAQNAGGVVKAGERTIARALNIELVTVGHVLSAAVTVGLLDRFRSDGDAFVCRIADWDVDQRRLGLPDPHRRRYHALRAERMATGRVSRVQRDARSAMWGNACWICKGPADEMDHVKPLAAGGLNVPANLRPICRPCNRRKSSRWPFDPASIDRRSC